MSAVQSLLVCLAYLLIGVAVARWAREKARRKNERVYQQIISDHADEGMIDTKTLSLSLLFACMFAWPAMAAFAVADKIRKKRA